MELVFKLTPVGSAGSATATTTTPIIRGTLRAIKVDYTSQPATTDVTVVENNNVGRTLVSLTNANTDITTIPADELTTNAGAGLTAYQAVYIESQLTITIAQGDPVADGLVVTILVEPTR